MEIFFLVVLNTLQKISRSYISAILVMQVLEYLGSILANHGEQFSKSNLRDSLLTIKWLQKQKSNNIEKSRQFLNEIK